MESIKVVWLSLEGIALLERRDGAVLAPRLFPAGGEEGLMEAAAASPGGVWRLLVERPEEEFVLERLPALRGGDRRRLPRATARRLFPDTPFRRWERMVDDRERQGWCFSAIADSRWLEPLLERLAAAGVRVESLTTPAQLLPTLLRRAGERDGERGGARLVGWYAFGGGLRLVLLRAGRPVATRLITAPRSPEEELSATRDYLRHQGVWPEGADDLDGQPSAGSSLLLTPPLLVAWAARLGVALPEGSRHADPLFAALLFEQAPAAAYAGGRSPSVRGVSVARAAALPLFAVALAIGSWQAVRALELRAEARGLLQTMPPPAIPPAGEAGVPPPRALVRAVERAEALSSLALRAEPPLRRLGRVFEAYPALRLSRLRWGVSERAAGRMSIDLEGEVSPFDGDYRRAVARVEGLAARLRREAGVVVVELSRAPLERGVSRERDAAVAARLPFALTLSVRIDDGWG